MPKLTIKYPAGILLASCAAAYLVLFWLNSWAPSVISAAATGEKLIALTVDDGPTAAYTPKMLEIFRSYGVKATFFVVGQQIEKNPALLVQEVQAGHELANHTYSHRNMDTLPRQDVIAELERTNGIIFKYTGKTVYWFRPPRRRHNWNVVQEAQNQGLTTVVWTAGVETSSTNDPEKMAARVMRRVKPGGIILLHDGYINRDSTLEALPLIIESLQKEGYKFVTLSELLRNGER